MLNSKRIEIFTDRYPLVGPIFWMVSLQFFVAQLIIGANWPTHYSLTTNTISDLGNTACGIYGGRYVCSPLHAWMNASFIVLGLTMIIGSTLIYHEFVRSRRSAVGFIFMALAGLGTALVGIFAENTIASLHEFGAALPFLVGNVALLVLGMALQMPRLLRYYTYFSGVVALSAFALFAMHQYLGLGLGGMERIVAYPQTFWLIIFGVYMTQNHYQRLSKA